MDARESTVDEVREAHARLASHYGEEVLPVSKVCEALEEFVRALAENESNGPYDPETGAAIRRHGLAAITFARKSNLLFRLLYLGQRRRMRKCPEHEGRWSGCQPEPCPHGCSVGSDVTGWLP